MKQKLHNKNLTVRARVCVCVCVCVCVHTHACARVDMCDVQTVATVSTDYLVQFCAEGIRTRKLYKTTTVNPTYENL